MRKITMFNSWFLIKLMRNSTSLFFNHLSKHFLLELLNSLEKWLLHFPQRLFSLLSTDVSPKRCFENEAFSVKCCFSNFGVHISCLEILPICRTWNFCKSKTLLVMTILLVLLRYPLSSKRLKGASLLMGILQWIFLKMKNPWDSSFVWFHLYIYS